MNLIYVKRTAHNHEVMLNPRGRSYDSVVNPHRILFDDGENATTHGTFFIVENDGNVEAAIKTLSESNPGKEVMVYRLQSVTVCPPADPITKKVTKDGILPA